MQSHHGMPWDRPIPEPDAAAMRRAQARWDNIAKPLGSLGRLEEAVVRIAGLTGDCDYELEERAVLVLCADNGVVCRGVTQTGSEVTAVLARNLVSEEISIAKMAEVANARVIPVDMGIIPELRLDGLLDRRIAAGTEDISVGPAMTREQAVLAIGHGIALVADMKNRGFNILATGEAGIGNTTTSSAMAAVFLSRPPAEVTGRGAGLSTEGVQRKVATIEKALAINSPDPDDALDVLAKLGGFDIAGLTGVFLGGAIFRVPILVDGLISSVAALTAQKLCPASKAAMIASHVSAEKAGALLLDALGLKPLICADMCLGEGTGAVAALPLLDMAYAVYRRMPTFEEVAIEQYQPLV